MSFILAIFASRMFQYVILPVSLGFRAQGFLGFRVQDLAFAGM